MTPHRTEPSLNPRLADAFSAGHPQSQLRVQETGLLADSHRQPDFVVDTPGRVRCLIENKYDNAAGRAALEEQCESHVGACWSDGDPVDAIVGVLSPETLSVCSESELAALIGTGTFCYAAWLPRGLAGSRRFPSTGWLEGSIRDLAAFIDRIGSDALDLTEVGVTLRQALAAGAETVSSDPLAPAAFAEMLDQQPGEQTFRMAMAVMFNAVVFQAAVAQHHAHIPSPTRMLSTDSVSQIAVLDAWRDILDMNYWPIFGISSKLLGAINNEEAARRMLILLYRQAVNLGGMAGAQGLVGRLFGELIGDRKFLAAFYTEPASAALLAELAIGRLNVDWADLEQAGNAHVGDLACGTGALLTAAYRRVAEKHRLVGGDDRDLHRRMLEDSLVGCDILAAAVHLTAARLSGEQPAIDYTSTRTWVMPYGDATQPDGTTQVKLGSLDLLGENEQWALWGDGSIEVAAAGESHQAVAAVPDESLDVVIMNPPFSRNTGHEAERVGIPQPAFAGLRTAVATQEAMAPLLKKRMGALSHRPAYSGQAGLASAFIDLAHTKLRPGGVLALILPVSVITGRAWRAGRQLITENYEDILILTISASTDIAISTNRAFSADTAIAEAVLVATKRSADADPAATGLANSARFAMIDGRPQTTTEALELARVLSDHRSPDRCPTLRLGDERLGWTCEAQFGTEMFGHPTGVASREVARVASGLADGELALPRLPPVAVDTVPLSVLARRGAYHMDINGYTTTGAARGPLDTEELDDRTTYSQVGWPILWAHDHTQETSIRVLPDSRGVVRHGMESKARRVWDGWTTPTGTVICGASRLHMNRDFRLNSQALGACLTPTAVIGGRAWPSATPRRSLTDLPGLWEKALALWLNTTPGLIARWWVSTRQQQGRANLTVTTIGNVPVLDLRAVRGKAVSQLAEECDRLETLLLLPANEAYRDPHRERLDETVLCEVLGLPRSILEPLASVREAWCAEPSVHGGKSTRPGG